MTAACAVVALIAGLSTPAAHAQRVAIAIAATGGPASTDLLDMVSGRTRRISDQPADIAFFTADGSVLVWHPSGGEEWRATVVDADIEVPLPANFVPSGAVHPRELAIFGTLSGILPIPLARLGAQGLHVFDACPEGNGVVAFDVVPDGSRLVVLCSGPFGTASPSVAHVDAMSGVVLRRTPVPPVPIPLAIVVTDEHYLLASWDRSIALERRRLSDDQPMGSGSVAVPRLSFAARRLLTPNPGWRDRPVMTWCPEISAGPTTTYSCQVAALDAVSPGVASTLQAAGPLYPGVSFTADGRQALVSGVSSASLVDIASAQASVTAPAPANGFIVAAWGAEPRAPSLVLPSVAASTVSLSWTLPAASAAVTGYRLEAGYAPGATAVSLDLGAAASVTIPGVPPGRYHVRIRAVNANGVTAPSNEVVIDVP